MGAKVALSAIVGLTAALTLHVAVSRFGASVGPATWIIGAFFTAGATLFNGAPFGDPDQRAATRAALAEANRS